MNEFIEKLIARLEERIKLHNKKAQGYANKALPTLAIDTLAKREEVKEIMNIVNQLAEEHKGGWIPCSERLPEENQTVLTCDKNGWISVNINMPYIGVKNDFECGYYIAWQPLPTPYTE